MQNLHDSLSVASQSWSIPPGILANPNYPYIAQGSSSIPLSISVKNFSSAPASDVYVKLTSTGGLSFASDSIYIGTIAPGADIIVPVNCIAPISDTLTTFTAEVFSSNVNGIGSGGAILIENGGILTNSHEVTNNKNDLIVYPNPSNGQLIIRFDSDAIRNLKMFDIHGREVLRTNLRGSLSNINIQNLSNGIYLLSVFENGSVKSIRVVKQ
jgi:hypothetical protein